MNEIKLFMEGISAVVVKSQSDQKIEKKIAQYLEMWINL
jgi:hypothetical protein